ncbi:hypothetical protein BB559_003309 [Furculomyces boomerangus]|uniref:Uncharacterized protein n=2 Tax=Harpellales TaxID=61421 RepID=A0A2T9YM30_9FUNG|nr:hypothetical protein BB559_007248 [Furculomyces boomerangus]PVU93403.1 hypothetical protein BB559_003309 [Furculomyces boomerangus]PVZ97279.1 hypothetical protein BB558_006766 [Smittium angustum]PWA02701.1 hypothetical protein BB558_001160 [Smittium angustum]
MNYSKRHAKEIKELVIEPTHSTPIAKVLEINGVNVYKVIIPKSSLEQTENNEPTNTNDNTTVTIDKEVSLEDKNEKTKVIDQESDPRFTVTLAYLPPKFRNVVPTEFDDDIKDQEIKKSKDVINNDYLGEISDGESEDDDIMLVNPNRRTTRHEESDSDSD